MYRELISSVVDYSGDIFRNIMGIREGQMLYDDLADDETDAALAFAAEALDKPASFEPLITRPFDYGTVITFPFLQENWHGSRFSDGLRYGVWYGSEELETTVYETVHHWRQFILDSYGQEDVEILGERRVFKVRCQGILIDVVGKEITFPGLVERESYAFTQPLGGYLHDQNQNGLLVRSARRREGINAALFRSQILTNPLDVCYLTYMFNPRQSTSITIERDRGRTWLTL
jgi:hypothetical protein